MTNLAKLIPNEIYRVAEVVENHYVVLAGYESAVPSAIYWTEFARVSPRDLKEEPAEPKPKEVKPNSLP